jgi:hypothetical protein
MGVHKMFSLPLSQADGPNWTWSSQVIDLTRFGGQDVKLDFVTTCNSCSSSTEAAWRAIELIQPSADYVRVVMSSFLPVEKSLHQEQEDAIWEYGEEVRIYKNDSAYPRAFVVHDVLAAENSDDALGKLANPDFDPSKQVIVEGATANETADVPSNVRADDFAAATVTKQQPDDVAIHVSMQQPGFLVLTDTFYPGWKATVDGQDAEIHPADYLFRGVYVGTGEHSVEYVYDPPSFKIGLSITVIALFVGIACFVYAMLGRLKSRPV